MRGSIQVPGTGRPIVMQADHQTTGGYPKIATVISADTGALAQLPPGHGLRFVAITPTQARAARSMPTPTLLPVGQLTSEDLLARNLVGGVVDAWNPDYG
jgi:allophanate hydrolase subunit 2